MKVGRRKFLEFAGFTVVVLAGRRLVPAVAEASSAPSGSRRGGRRWAMVIDPRKCLKEEGCRACIQACHAAHNVPSVPDPRHDVKWIWKEPFTKAFPDQEAEYVDEALTSQPVLVFCNHCDNPPCVKVCPTQATWRREDGIVMMDWHRCIGCRYCVAGCPYGSRSFNWRDPRPFVPEVVEDFPTRTKGVVEKCTFCEERLAKDLPPACVAACREGALVFGDLNDPASQVRTLLRSRFAVRRKPALGTHPAVYYLV